MKKDTILNKIVATILIGVGILSAVISKDGTFLVLISIISIPLFFSKRNWII